MTGEGITGEELQVLVQYKLVAALQEREHDLAEAQRLARIGSWTWDLSGAAEWSDELYRVFGVSEETFTPTYEAFLSLVRADDRPRMEDAIRDALESAASFEVEIRLDADAGAWVRARGQVDVDPDGNPRRMHGTVQGITEEVQARTELERLGRAYAGLARTSTADHVWLHHDDGTIHVLAAADERTDRVRSAPVNPSQLHELVHPADVSHLEAEIIRLRGRPGATMSTRFRMTDLDGEWRSFEASGVNASDDAAIGGTLLALRQIRPDGIDPHGARGSGLDPLTGLCDHAQLVGFVDQAVARSERHDWSTAIVALDVDDFHRINQEHGHQTGDAVLIDLARRLVHALRVSDLVARPASDDPDAVGRFGADRFVAVCEDVADEDAGRSIAQRLQAIVMEPLLLPNGDAVPVTASIGIAIAGPSGPTSEERIHRAEEALRSAKHEGPGACVVTIDGVATPAETRIEAERSLQRAFSAGEFVLHYQPKLSLGSDRVTGAEGLIRWEHPERGLIPPLEFIPLAEETGLIVAMGAWVIHEGCRQAAEWNRRFARRPPLVISVNVSSRQFGAELVAVVADALADSSLGRGQLCLEVTESTLTADPDLAVAILHRLAHLGVKLSIDDFGTGYSSLSYLQRFPLDELKIDKSFVDGLGRDSNATAIIGATVAMAHALGLSVVAEGVESADQMERLRVLGCQEAQGYHISRPQPAETITALLDNEKETAHGVTPRTGAATAHDYRPQRILIVDDTEDVRLLAQMALSAAGYAVDVASSGAEAIDMATNLPPDCVILDMSMPGLSGVEVCRALRQRPSLAGCTILMLTSRNAAEDKVDAFSAGADDYIIKPFSPRDLVGRVQASLRRPMESTGDSVDAAVTRPPSND